MACVFTLGVAGALAAFVPAATPGASAADADGRLGVSIFTFGDRSLTALSLASSEPVAHVRLSVPAGYAVDLGRPAGTFVGVVSAVLNNTAGTSSPAFADGELVVDDPAKYATDASAQDCAPGTHAAVWHTTLSVLGQSFSLPIFLDPGGSTDSGPTALVLQFCPTWSAPNLPGGVTAQGLTFFAEGAFTQPTAPGRYTWSALVTPAIPGSLAPDPSRTFELRSLIPHPHTLTLRARHDAKTKSVVLTGKLTAAGEPEPGVEISFGASTDSSSDFTSFGPVTTNALGEFSIRRHVERTTQFSASADTTVRPCTAPSSAPAGCLAETVSPPSGAATIVRVRRASDPKLAARPRDQALARRISLKLADFPPGWQAFDTFPVFSCPGFRPRLSDLTVAGDLESPTFATEQGVASSRASIYISEAQARTAFAREARLAAARCFADELRADGYTVLQLKPLPFASLGSETRAFRVVASDREEVLTLDLVSFRQGRAVVHMGFASLVQPLPIENDLAAKVAARARGA